MVRKLRTIAVSVGLAVASAVALLSVSPAPAAASTAQGAPLVYLFNGPAGGHAWVSGWDDGNWYNYGWVTYDSSGWASTGDHRWNGQVYFDVYGIDWNYLYTHNCLAQPNTWGLDAYCY